MSYALNSHPLNAVPLNGPAADESQTVIIDSTLAGATASFTVESEAAVEYESIRLRIDARATGSAEVTLAEIALDNGIVVAGQTYSTSGTPNYGELSELFDGDPSTFLGFFDDLPFYIQIDFATPQAITEIRLTAEPNFWPSAPSGFTVLAAEPGGALTEIFSVTDEPEWAEGETRTYSFDYTVPPAEAVISSALQSSSLQMLAVHPAEVEISASLSSVSASVQAFHPAEASIASALDGAAAQFSAGQDLPLIAESVADASDEAWVISYPLAESVADAVDELFRVSAERAVLAIEQANAADQVMPGILVPPIEEVAEASDTAWTGPVALLASEVAAAEEELILSATGSVTVSETANASDEVWQATVVMAESVADASDTATTGYYLMAEEQVDATDEAMASVTAYAMAEEQANAEDELWAVVESLQIVTVVADAIDQVLAPDKYAMAMVMNVETGAPYLYDNFPMMAAAQAGENIFAIGTDGLYRLDGNDDEGFAIDAHVELPGLSLGKPDGRGGLSRSPERKRVNSVWLDCEADTAMTLEVESYDQGMLKHQYQAIRALDDTGNMKVDVGKGLKSKWWGMTIRNTNGGDFTLLGASADVAATARRR